MPGWDETEDTVRYQRKDPSKFAKGSFRTKALANGVQLVLARTVHGGLFGVQSLRFPKPKWTMAKAKDWLESHHFSEAPAEDAPMGTLLIDVGDVAEFGEAPEDLRNAGVDVPVDPAMEQGLFLDHVAMNDASDSDSDDEKRKKLAARAAHHGIPAREDAHLSPPAGKPTSAGQYADPVNYRYPLADKAHADNARVRFKQQEGKPYPPAAQRIIHNRIVRAQLRHGSHPSFDPNDRLDKMLSPDVKMRLARLHKMGEDAELAYMAEAGGYDNDDDSDDVASGDVAMGNTTVHSVGDEGDLDAMQDSKVLNKHIHRMLAHPKMADDETRKYLMKHAQALHDGGALSKADYHQVKGISTELGLPWPTKSGPVGGAPTVHDAPYHELPGGMNFKEGTAGKPGGICMVGADGTSQWISFADISAAETYNIPNVPIFRAGTHKGQEWTVDDLRQIVENNQTVGNEIKPPLIIGHSDKILKSGENDDSQPAVGWVSGLKLVGDQILANFTDVPRVVRDLIDRRAYRRVSPEIYWNFRDSTGAARGKALRAVALLGGATPEVKTLNDVTLLYKETPAGDARQVVCIDYTEASPGGEQDVNELETLKAKLAEEQKAREAAERRAIALAEQQREQSIAFFVEAQKTRGVLVKADEPLVTKLLRAIHLANAYVPENSVARFAELTDGKGVVALFEEFVASRKPQVDLTERVPQPPARTDGSAPGAPLPGSGGASAPGGGELHTFTDAASGYVHTVQGVDLLTKAREYMASHQGVRMEEAVATIQRNTKAPRPW